MAFRAFDNDKDGHLGFKEFLEGANYLGINFTDKEIKEAFDELDIDGDGYINFDEFCSLHDGKAQ